jgi:threonine dehydrogenase-like Zn-dependent dehydrogenase
MPYELIATGPRNPGLREYEEPILQGNQIRIKTEFASPKHGTEMVFYRGDNVSRKRYDRDLGCMIPRDDDENTKRFPMHLGNMATGVVTETGRSAKRFAVGTRVFGHLPVRETHTVEENAVDPLPDGLAPQAVVCLDPLVMALAMRDAGIQIGDIVAVFGLGAIGLMAVQLARMAGADAVIGVDPVAARRTLASRLGASDTLDPTADGGDVGIILKRKYGGNVVGTEQLPVRVVGGYRDFATQTGQRGVDVAVEVSGNIKALHQAIRGTRFGGKVCMLSFYGGNAEGLHLGEEFHINQLQLLSARTESIPLRAAPAWGLERIVELALRWLVEGRIKTEGIVNPIVSLSRSVEAYRRIDEHPEESTKIGITFD